MQNGPGRGLNDNMSPEETKPEESKDKPAAKAEDIKTPEAKPTQPPAKEAAKAKAEPKKTEKGANCPVCSKALKKMWYYRNGVYYCGKGCFQQARKKANAEKKKAEEAKAAPNEPRIP